MEFKDILYSKARTSLEQTLKEMRGVKVYGLRDKKSTLYTTQPQNTHVSEYDEHVKRYTQSTYSQEVTRILHWLGYLNGAK